MSRRQDLNHETFGPGYVPPAERIRRARDAGQRPPHGTGRPAHPERPPNLRGVSASFVLGSIGVIALVMTVVFFAVDGPARLAAMDDCQEFHDALRYHLEIPKTWSKPPRTTDEAEARARSTAEAYQSLADDLESFTLEDPTLDDLRVRFAEFAVESQGTLRSYRCREEGAMIDCTYWDAPAATQFERDVTGLMSEYNNACIRYNVNFYPRLAGANRRPGS